MRRTDEVLMEALGDKANEYMSLSNVPVYEKKNFAKTSKFYGQIMDDGYVFNPYIHRRWLPAQYEREKEDMCLSFLRDKIDTKYAYHVMRDEISKMYTLFTYDKDAFEERKKFFTLDTCKEFLISYCEGIKYSIFQNSYNLWLGGEFENFYILIDYKVAVDKIVREGADIKFQSVVSDYKFRELIEIIKDRINKSSGYGELWLVINKYPLNLVPCKSSIQFTEIPNSFLEAYWKAGAYYSIKNNLMFKKGKIDGKSGTQGCEHLRSLLDNGISAQELHDIYMNM